MLITDLLVDNAGLKFSAYQRMTAAIVETVNKVGDCGPNDLIGRGFHPEDIKQHWPMAKALAHIALNLMDAA